MASEEKKRVGRNEPQFICGLFLRIFPFPRSGPRSHPSSSFTPAFETKDLMTMPRGIYHNESPDPFRVHNSMSPIPLTSSPCSLSLLSYLPVVTNHDINKSSFFPQILLAHVFSGSYTLLSICPLDVELSRLHFF